MRIVRFAKTWNLATLLLAGFAIILVAGCGNFFRDSNELAGISVSPANSLLQLNKTQQFTAIGTLGDSSDKDISSTVEWKSSSPKVALIDSSGMVTAVSTGLTTITASQSGVSGSTGLTVTVRATGLTVTPSTAVVSVGDTVEFAAKNNDTAVSGVTWSSSQTNVATVDQNGVATGKSAGTTAIIATVTTNGTQVQGTASLTVQ